MILTILFSIDKIYFRSAHLPAGRKLIYTAS